MADQYFIQQGRTPKTVQTEFNLNGTKAIFSPSTSMRVVLTALTIANTAAPSGTFVITMGNVGGSKVAEFFVAGSASISPVIGAIETTAFDRAFFGTPTSSPSAGWQVTAYGFELQ